MRDMILTVLLVAAMAMAAPRTLHAAGKAPGGDVIGYADTDNDQVNDLFRDANGDGVNDVTGEPYNHQFDFADADGDGVNDLFIDANGNGVNDYAETENRGLRLGIGSRFIDANADGVNDITGERVVPPGMGMGFVDEDGDGINDNAQGRVMPGPPGLGRGNDRFIDEDGDGINDGRGFSPERRRQGMWLPGDVFPPGHSDDHPGSNGGNSGNNPSGSSDTPGTGADSPGNHYGNQ